MGTVDCERMVNGLHDVCPNLYVGEKEPDYCSPDYELIKDDNKVVFMFISASESESMRIVEKVTGKWWKGLDAAVSFKNKKHEQNEARVVGITKPVDSNMISPPDKLLRIYFEWDKDLFEGDIEFLD